MPKAVIVSVGGSKEPIVYVLNKFRPQYIFFFASSQSKFQIEEIRKQLKFSPLGVENIITPSAEDLGKCYKALRDELLKKMDTWKIKAKDLIPDYTGGTKTMSCALVLATIDMVNRYSYIGGKERNKDGLGVVIEGKEKNWYRKNPWKQLAIFELKNFNTYFNTARYRMAREILEKLKEKVSREEGVFYEILHNLTCGYEKWDYFKHKKAYELLQKAPHRLQEYLAGRENKKLKRLIKKVQKNVNFLLKVKKEKDKDRLLIYDLLSNADRRAKLESKFDDAVARLYRALEKTAQVRLWEKYRISTKNVELSDIPENLREEFENKYKDDEGRIKIGAKAAYRLLKELGDELGEKYCKNKERVERVLNIRNNSILAHGDTPVSEETYNDLKEIVFEFAEIEPKELPEFPLLDL